MSLNYVSTEYVLKNFLSPVRFYESLRKIPEDAVVLEVSAASLFRTIIKRSLPKAPYVGLMRKREEGNNINFLRAIGSLYLHGYEPEVSKIYEADLPLPLHSSTPILSTLMAWEHSDLLPLPDFLTV